MKRLKNEFNNFWKKIENCENFALLRYGDGERAFMTGQSVTAQEGWTSPNKIGKLGLALISTLNFNDNTNVYYAISCPCCDQAAYYWYKSRIHSNKITFANLFINANYKKFIKKFEKLERDAIFIGNYRAQNKKIGNLNLLKSYFVDDNCNEFWENKASNLINNIKEDFGGQNNLLYVVSAGPMSEPIIAELYKHNPNNCYIDFGSAIDTYIHGIKTRPYMNKHSKYSKRNCWMHSDNVKFDTTAVLTLYKRPQHLEEQLIALKNQTLKPKKIILFHDKAENTDNIIIPKHLVSEFDNIITVSKNIGVWGRFAGALITDTEYICILDDDTIPGKRWLENCHNEMQKRKGIYGTIGILCRKVQNYPYKSYSRIGWANPNKTTQKVNFVGHSWFLKKDWLGAMFINNNKYFKLNKVGEDAYLSLNAKKFLNINTYVPPHPKNNLDLWGSLPEQGKKYGTEEHCISFSAENYKLMNKALKLMHKEGLKPLITFYQMKYFFYKYICIFIPFKKIRKSIRENF